MMKKNVKSLNTVRLITRVTDTLKKKKNTEALFYCCIIFFYHMMAAEQMQLCGHIAVNTSF